ncbi:hypothetical protein [Streptomyces sp. NPDC093261]|uniref:hypothetical protein n=1 Tax=Streptomyces sp. NPDC093261 TaxID=3366037 RepID=UPI00380154AF
MVNLARESIRHTVVVTGGAAHHAIADIHWTARCVIADIHGTARCVIADIHGTARRVIIVTHETARRMIAVPCETDRHPIVVPHGTARPVITVTRGPVAVDGGSPQREIAAVFGGGDTDEAGALLQGHRAQLLPGHAHAGGAERGRDLRGVQRPVDHPLEGLACHW